MKKIIFLISALIVLSGILSAQTLYVVGEEITIESEEQYDEIIIGNFGILTIENTTVYMSGNIKVNDSGKLIIDHSTITKSDLVPGWDGIVTGSEYSTGDLKGNIEIKNGSIIEYANYGVDIKGDGKLTVLGDMTKFRYNNYGIHLRLSPSSSWDLNPEISIKDATFEENDYGIEMHKQNGTIEIDNCKFFYNSKAGIFFNEDIPESLISVNNCEFYGASDNIYCKNLFDLKIDNCIFNSGNCGINTRSSTGLEIVGSIFGRELNFGVKLENSDCEIKNNNRFYAWHGIVAVSDQLGIGSVKITDNNYFNSYFNDIDLTGMDSHKKSAITGNYFNDCKDAISIEGSNYYIVSDNTFNNSDNPVFASATGYIENQILCNFMDQTSEYGIELKNDNYSTTFMGNYFTYGGLADVKIDGTIENHIGDDTHPAENHFSEESGDIKISSNTPYFHYFLAPDAMPDTDPDNIADDDIPESWEVFSESGSTPPDCIMPPGTIETNFEEWWQYYCTLLADYEENKSFTVYKQIKLLETKLKRQLFYICYELGLDYRTMLEIMMQYCETFFSQKMMYYLYLHYDDCEKADSVLSVIEYSLTEPVGTTKMDTLDRINKESFVNINRIGQRYHCDTTGVDTIIRSDTLYRFTEEELNTLYTETYRGIPQSAYAKALYFIGTGDLLMFERSERNLEPRSKTEKDNVQIAQNEVLIFPNPAIDKINIVIDNRSKLQNSTIDAKLYIYDMYGKKVIDRNLKTFNESINVSMLNTGVYVLSITDKAGNTVRTEKLVINHK